MRKEAINFKKEEGELYGGGFGGWRGKGDWSNYILISKKQIILNFSVALR